MDQYLFYLLFLGIPFACLTFMYIILTVVNRETTGEIKWILPPDILLKVFTVFMLVSVIFILAIMKLIQESTVSALLGSIASGAIGMALSLKKSEPQEKSTIPKQEKQ